ncbi:MAG: phosphoesterase [Candidatus Eremiobacter antarcticus]|nr:phosphoesterase [Candidatus Eremiobacteraeota bacterium]PZR60283.1 MAG: phosphoesterase [Candidatus Eremiobacter sp. RRmetagenome_bin22]
MRLISASHKALLSALVCVALFAALGGALSQHSRVQAQPVNAQAALVAALRGHVKHVFFIYQENHSFDEYFGTFPGADNLATAAARAHGFRQYDPTGRQWVTPFRITDPDIDSPKHSRGSLLAKMNGGKADQYVAVQEQDSAKDGYDAADSQRIALLTMSHYDCDTLPFLWKYARGFALYDRFFQGMTGPSTPGNIEIIAAQTGQTQWARNPQDAVKKNKGPGVPIVSSIDPAFGPYPGKPDKQVEISQRYATVLLTMNGRNDVRATQDTDGVREDLALMTRSGRMPVPWGWFQEGFKAPDAALEGYSSHRNAVQYFGYMRHNDVFWKNVHDVKALLPALSAGTLPERSVVYIKGGSYNHFGWRPANKSAFIQKHFLGDDDHPGTDDSDRHVAEAFVATFVNAIARSKYWKDSAIIVTWDDSGGFYDHATPPQFERCPDGKPCGDGPRLPFILISPYAKSGAVIHDVGDTGSLVKLVNTLFGLPPLASLPDERPYMPEGPRDGNPRLTDLTGGFDPQRLSGAKPVIPAAAAEIPDKYVNAFPPPVSCRSLGIVPVPLPGTSQRPPRGYAPLPAKYIP